MVYSINSQVRRPRAYPQRDLADAAHQRRLPLAASYRRAVGPLYRAIERPEVDGD